MMKLLSHRTIMSDHHLILDTNLTSFVTTSHAWIQTMRMHIANCIAKVSIMFLKYYREHWSHLKRISLLEECPAKQKIWLMQPQLAKVKYRDIVQSFMHSPFALIIVLSSWQNFDHIEHGSLVQVLSSKKKLNNCRPWQIQTTLPNFGGRSTLHLLSHSAESYWPHHSKASLILTSFLLSGVCLSHHPPVIEKSYFVCSLKRQGTV